MPAIGYSPAQVEALRATIVHSAADVVLAAGGSRGSLVTSVLVVRVRYELEDVGEPTLAAFVDRWLAGARTSQRGEAAPPAPVGRDL